MVLDLLEVSVAPTICPCILGTGEYSISPGAAPPDLYLLMYFSLQQERLHILGGINPPKYLEPLLLEAKIQ